MKCDDGRSILEVTKKHKINDEPLTSTRSPPTTFIPLQPRMISSPCIEVSPPISSTPTDILVKILNIYQLHNCHPIQYVSYVKTSLILVWNFTERSWHHIYCLIMLFLKIFQMTRENLWHFYLFRGQKQGRVHRCRMIYTPVCRPSFHGPRSWGGSRTCASTPPPSPSWIPVKTSFTKN